MIRSLSVADLDGLLVCFNAAFAGYHVPMSLTAAQLYSMLTRRGWSPELSSAAFDNGRMVAFALNCVDGGTAYNTGTGTLPDARGRGLARSLMQRSASMLAEAGIGEYRLEVIDANAAAIALYRGLAFEERRRLDCWGSSGQRPDKSGQRPVAGGQGELIPAAWCDAEPSWQNSAGSIARALEPHVVLGDERGRIVLFPSTGDVPQLAVNPEHRRRGVGRRLVEGAAALAGRPLRFLNVDSSSAPARAFFEAVGFSRLVSQIEMRRRLS